MYLELESGRMIHEATENDILTHLKVEVFSILSISPDVYIQCKVSSDAPGAYILEYQEGSLKDHYRAIDGPISLADVQSAFLKYIRRDPSWQLDFCWEKMKL